MALKIYGIDNRTVAVVRIPAGDGRAWIECEFTKGRPAKGANYKPATYATADATEQTIIERSPYFMKMIRLVEIYDLEGPRKVEKKDEEQKIEPLKSLQEFPDVTTYEQALSVLKSLGAKATQLSSSSSIKKYMATKRVVFPNYKID